MPYQVCAESEGWVLIPVRSSTTAGLVYDVVLSEWDGLCDCTGFKFNGTCSHIEKAQRSRCRWKEGVGACQTPEQRSEGICPDCGGETRIKMEVHRGET